MVTCGNGRPCGPDALGVAAENSGNKHGAREARPTPRPSAQGKDTPRTWPDERTVVSRYSTPLFSSPFSTVQALVLSLLIGIEGAHACSRFYHLILALPHSWTPPRPIPGLALACPQPHLCCTADVVKRHRHCRVPRWLHMKRMDTCGMCEPALVVCGGLGRLTGRCKWCRITGAHCMSNVSPSVGLVRSMCQVRMRLKCEGLIGVYEKARREVQASDKF